MIVQSLHTIREVPQGTPGRQVKSGAPILSSATENRSLPDLETLTQKSPRTMFFSWTSILLLIKKPLNPQSLGFPLEDKRMLHFTIFIPPFRENSRKSKAGQERSSCFCASKC